jgi:hypothetical protein
MNFFEIMAECSIALPGFGAVHAALRGSNHPRGVFRAWTIVLLGAIAFLLCILPLLLALTDLPAERLWTLASTVGLPIAVIAAISGIKFDSRLTEIGYPSQGPMILRVAQVSTVIAVVVLLSVVIGWPAPPGPFYYAIAPVSLLFAALLAMLHAFLVPMQMVFTQKQPQTPEADEISSDERVL